MSKRSRVIAALGVTLVVVGWFCRDIRFHRVTRYTCSRCRAIEHVSSWFGHDFESVEDTDYSRWFSQLHAGHDHHWCWVGSAKTYTPLYVALGHGLQHPVWTIPEEDQKRFVESASAQDLEKFYACIDSADLTEERKGADMVAQRTTGDTK